MSESKFPQGRLVWTNGVNDWIASATADVAKQALECLRSHMRGDWGDICPGDEGLNDQALIDGNRLMSAYTVNDTKIWIITEWDRSVTTILFPEEY